jgi:hypothetical protein
MITRSNRVVRQYSRRNQFIGYMRDRVYHDEDLKQIFHKYYQKLDDTSGVIRSNT